MVESMRLRFMFRAVTALLLAGLLPLPGWSESDKAAAPPEGTEYTIEDIHGSAVQVLESGETQWEAAVEGQLVDAGDEVKVGAASDVSLMLGTETSVHLDENSDLKIETLSPSQAGGFLSRLQVLAGRLMADVKKNLQQSQSSFEVESNGVICGVRGTAFEVEAEGDDAKVTTHEGKVEVAGGGETHMVTEGNFSAFKKGRFQLLRRLGQNERQRFQRWRALRQIIRQKRLQRLTAIQNHRLQPWVRKHPRLDQVRPNLNRDSDLKKRAKRKLLRKKLRQEAR